MSKKIPIPKTAHLAKALVSGEVISIMDGFRRFLVTNAPREISRQIEQKFDVRVSRERVEFKTDLGLPGFYVRYRLNHAPHNEEGIRRILEYLEEYFPAPKEEEKTLKQAQMF